jgi:hypothetical protein
MCIYVNIWAHAGAIFLLLSHNLSYHTLTLNFLNKGLHYEMILLFATGYLVLPDEVWLSNL